MTRVELLTAIVCSAVLGACAYTPRVKPTREPDGLLTGSATYREGVAIPRDAVLEVWIRDLSPLALAAPIVAETAVLAEGRQVPLPFELKYERRRIVADRSYAATTGVVADARGLDAAQFLPGDSRAIYAGLSWKP